MTERWEYLALIWRESCERLSKEPPTFAFRRELFVYRPGLAEPEKMLLWSSKEGEEGSKKSILDLMNELGAEGWELVTDAPIDSVIATSHSTGWSEAGIPVLRQWLFKRSA